MIREAEQEYNKLRMFGTRFNYPMGTCDNIVDLFQKLRVILKNMKLFNDEKITNQELINSLFDNFKGDLESSYKKRKKLREIRRILKPIIANSTNSQSLKTGVE